MRRISIALLLLAAAACRREAPAAGKAVRTGTAPADLRNANVNVESPVAAPAFVDHAAIGATVGSDGNVSNQTTTFVPGQPIYVTLWFRESPTGLHAGVRWYNPEGKEFKTDFRPMNGAKTATFVLNDKLMPGKYKVEGYWGGNYAGEMAFEVTGKKERGRPARTPGAGAGRPRS